MPFADLSLSDSAIQRRAKIVATLGPASNTEPVFRNLVRAGLDVVRLNFSHGTYEEKTGADPDDPQGQPGDGQAALHPRRSAGTQDPDVEAEGSPAGSAAGRPARHHHAARCSRYRIARWHHIQDPGGKRGAGLAHSALRRPHRAPRARSDRRRRGLRDDERRHAGRKQGHQSARHPGARSFADGKGRSRPRIRPAQWRGCHRRFICAHGGGHPSGAQPRFRVRQRNLDHCQAGKAAGHRATGPHSPGLRRHHGGARRSRRGGSAGARSGHPEAHHPQGQRVSQAGHHRHADAGIDDRQSRGPRAPKLPTWPTPFTTAPTR